MVRLSVNYLVNRREGMNQTEFQQRAINEVMAQRGTTRKSAIRWLTNDHKKSAVRLGQVRCKRPLRTIARSRLPLHHDSTNAAAALRVCACMRSLASRRSRLHQSSARRESPGLGSTARLLVSRPLKSAPRSSSPCSRALANVQDGQVPLLARSVCYSRCD